MQFTMTSTAPMRRERKGRNLVLLLVLGAVVLLGSAGMLVYREVHKTTQHTDNSTIIAAAEHWVRMELGPMVRPRFQSNDFVTVEEKDGKMIVNGNVEALYLDSAVAVGYDFTCVLVQDTDGEWQPLDIRFMSL